ncbi:MAG: Na+/H+ antiporter, partial [Actinomycetota bacterium]|nr:Na+/H+ antiporter [Actinomycetota bacterium]
HVLDRLRQALDRRGDSSATGAAASDAAEATYRSLRRRLITVESDELDRLHRSGSIDDATRRRLQRDLDLEDAGLDDRDRP